MRAAYCLNCGRELARFVDRYCEECEEEWMNELSDDYPDIDWDDDDWDDEEDDPFVFMPDDF